ncbi:hypothetical protein BDR07DRAFT_1372929 [Suillus spraguei]|nr:hypothetical protein BDR07DRAFT_1372929 [Suillus spraguei]
MVLDAVVSSKATMGGRKILEVKGHVSSGYINYRRKQLSRRYLVVAGQDGECAMPLQVMKFVTQNKWTQEEVFSFQVDKVVVEEYGRMAVEGVGSHRLKRGIGELNGSRKRTKNSSRMFGGQNSLIMSIGVGYVLDQDVNVVDNCSNVNVRGWQIQISLVSETVDEDILQVVVVAGCEGNVRCD